MSPHRNFIFLTVLLVFTALPACAESLKISMSETRDMQAQEQNLLEQSKDMYLVALENNPWHSGTYADLANAYYMDFEIPTAWICWENARRLNPTLPQNLEFEAMERRIPNDFPEYF